MDALPDDRIPDVDIVGMGVPDLDTRIATALVRIGEAARGKAWERAVAQGLTPTQGHVLLRLSAARGGMRLAAIAHELGLTTATTSEAVSALERKGLVIKHRDTTDSRALAIELSPAGAAMAQECGEWPEFLRSALQELPVAEKRALLSSLITVIRVLLTRGDIPVMRMCVTCQFFAPNVHIREEGSDPETPHHCRLINAPLGLDTLRLDCPEHEQADLVTLRRRWEVMAA